MDKDNFKLLLEYLRGMQGGSRARTKEKAQAILDTPEDADATEDQNTLRRIAIKRATKVIKLFKKG